MITREQSKEELLGYLYIDGVLPKIVNRKYVEDLFNKIYDEHEAEMKQAYIDGSNSCNELIQSLYKQIEQLKYK